MRVLAVTGGIGSGKSEVCRILARHGFGLQYNADARAKALYHECPGLLERIETELGCVLRDGNGTFMPSVLASVIFSDKGAMEKLETLLYPEMIRDFNRMMQEVDENQIVIFESATFLEKRQFDGFADMVLLVEAPFELRLDRACRRDKADREAVLARMKCQILMNGLSEGQEDPRISFRVRNAGTHEELEREVLRLLNEIENINI